jgi:F5/8 type C domain
MQSKELAMRRFTVAALALLALDSAGTWSRGDTLIPPVSVTGTGSYNNSASLIIDGVLPPRYTNFEAPTNVYWFGTGPEFTISLGHTYTVSNLTVDVDNNDDYVVQYSTDGVNFTNLFTFLASYGPVPVVPGGLDILTTIPTYPTDPGDNTTPAYVGTGFAPVQASYLRIFAQNGDGDYAIGEVQAFTPSAVPEPSALILGVTAILLGTGLHWTRRRFVR